MDVFQKSCFCSDFVSADAVSCGLIYKHPVTTFRDVQARDEIKETVLAHNNGEEDLSFYFVIL